VGKRREKKGNKDIVQKVASVGNSYCNIYKKMHGMKNLKNFVHQVGDQPRLVTTSRRGVTSEMTRTSSNSTVRTSIYGKVISVKKMLVQPGHLDFKKN